MLQRVLAHLEVDAMSALSMRAHFDDESDASTPQSEGLTSPGEEEGATSRPNPRRTASTGHTEQESDLSWRAW